MCVASACGVWAEKEARRRVTAGESQPGQGQRSGGGGAVEKGNGEGSVWCVACGVWRVACGVWGRGVRAGMRVVSRVHVWLWVSRGAGVAQRHS